jgi:hypothetical protein
LRVELIVEMPISPEWEAVCLGATPEERRDALTLLQLEQKSLLDERAGIRARLDQLRSERPGTL